MNEILRNVWQDPSARKLLAVGVIGVATWVFDQLFAATGKGQFKTFVNAVAVITCLIIALDVIGKALASFGRVLGIGE